MEGTTSSTTNASSTSTKNQVVTLRASASGRRGYCSQDLSTNQSSSPDSLGAENSVHPTDITDSISDMIPPLDVESDTQTGSGAKSRLR